VGLGSILLLGIARRSANDVGYDVYLAPIPSSRRGRPNSLIGLNAALTSLTGHPAVVVRKWNERRWRADQLQAPPERLWRERDARVEARLSDGDGLAFESSRALAQFSQVPWDSMAKSPGTV
jgi:hypothetical protein